MVGHGWYFLKDPFQIRVRIVAEDAAVFYQSVDDGTAPNGVLASYEEPVLCPYFEWTHGILCRVVVETRRVLHGKTELVPLVQAIADGFAHCTFGEVGFLELKKPSTEFIEKFFVIPTPVVNDGFGRVMAFCNPLFEAVLGMVEPPDVIEYDVGVFAVGLGVFELTPGVNPATSQRDYLLFGCPCFIGAVTVTLQDTLKASPSTC